MVSQPNKLLQLLLECEGWWVNLTIHLPHLEQEKVELGLGVGVV